MPIHDEREIPFSARPHDGALFLAGELDIQTAAAAQHAFLRALDDTADGCVVVDLTALTFCGSAGLQELLVLAHASDELGGQVTLRHVAPVIVRLLEITGLESREFASTTPSSPEAYADVEPRRSEPARGS